METVTDEMIEKKFLAIMEEDPTRMMLYFLVQMGKTVVESDADVMDLKTAATIEGQRYEIKAKITTKKLRGKP